MAFLTVKTVDEVLDLLKTFNIETTIGKVDLVDAVGLTLAEEIISPMSLPPYNRSAVDGYCVFWDDTSGASESIPMFLKVIGDVEMGKEPQGDLKRNCTMSVATGSMLPKNANAVVMVEHTERLSEDEVAIYESVASYENCLLEGEDIKCGEVILKKGSKLSPENINLLAALGIKEVSVHNRIKVGILSTGDELVDYKENVTPGKIYNSNGPGLIAAVRESGGIPLYYGIIADQLDVLTNALKIAVEECHIVILTGGTSVGAKDFVTQAINNLGEPGVLVHGIAMKPGKPTIIGQIDSVPIFGLSGNPVSAMISFRLFIKGLIKKVNYNIVRGKVTRNIPSSGGRQDYIPVRLLKNSEGVQIEPIFAKSNSIGALTKMDGLLVIGKDCEGIIEGSEAEVLLQEGDE